MKICYKIKNFRLLKYGAHDVLRKTLKEKLEKISSLLKNPVFPEKNRYFAGNSTLRCPDAFESTRNGKSTSNYPRDSFTKLFSKIFKKTVTGVI